MVYSLSEIAERLEGRMIGTDVQIRGAASLSEAQPGDLAFMESMKYLPDAERSAASALLIPPDVSVNGKSAIQVRNPRLAFATVLSLFDQPPSFEPSVHPTAILEEGVQVHPTATVMAYAYLGARTVVEAGAVLYPMAYLGADVTIGEGTTLFPHVTLYDRVTVGKRVRIHSGTVLGADGFGYDFVEGRHLKVPHIGSVLIEDDVEIGANSTIDRAKTGVTRIGPGTKIDNLVQVGHNVQIGANCIIVAQVGLAGSSQLEDYVFIGGQAAVKEHIRLGRGAILTAKAGVINDVPPGETVSGLPARPHKQWLKTKAAVQKLPDLLIKMKEMEQRIKDLEEKQANSEN
jgi:UDP-3-O-[3-hydroxymyristoyl] glucosamine N-acyltransferase